MQANISGKFLNDFYLSCSYKREGFMTPTLPSTGPVEF